MAKPGRIYRITHQCYDPTSDIQEVVDLSDNDYLIGDGDDAEIVNVNPGGEPVTSSVIDADEDPLTSIRAQQLTLQINTDNPVNMNTFASGSDQRWGVHNYIGNKTLFKGFVNLDDIDEDFMPEPNVLVITANDGLGSLRDQDLTDFDGNNLIGEYTIGEIIAMCLAKTGTPLQIKAAFNIKLSGLIDDIRIPNANAQHFFSTEWLNAKTFESGDGFMSCHEVLQKILGQEACVFQRQGFWWIMRVDEIEHPTRGLYISLFDENGVFVENQGEKSFDNEVGKDSPYTIFFSREQTKVNPTRPNKSVKLTFPYDIPDFPENRDFEKGDLNSTISPTDKHYDLNNWVVLRGNPLSPSLPSSLSYIRRIFNANDYEIERYAVITSASAASLSTTNDTYMRSMAIPMMQGDKFDVNLDWKVASGITGFAATYSLLKIILVTPAGAIYLLGNRTIGDHTTPPKWYNTANWTVNTAAGGRQINWTDLEETEWQSIDIEAPPIPADGKVYVLLHQLNQSGDAGDNKDIYYSSLQFTYLPLINGSYRKYVNQSQEVVQAGNFKAKRDEDVFISDAPRPAIKGALMNGLIYHDVHNGSVQYVSGTAFKIAGYHVGKFQTGQRLNISGTVSNNFQARVKEVAYTIIGAETVIEIDHATVAETVVSLVQELTFELSTGFYNAAVYPDGPPDSTYIHPYSEIQVFDVWNQFMFDKRVFEATLQGQDLAEVDADLLANNAHLIHKWRFTDVNENTNDRIFQLLTFEHSHRTGEWKGVFREVYNLLPAREKQYTGRTFKYGT